MTEIKLKFEPINSEQLLIDVLSFEQKWMLINIHKTLQLIDGIVDKARSALKTTCYDLYDNNRLAELNEVLDNFYLEQAFSSASQGIAASSLNSLHYLVHYHTGECLSMSLLLNHVLLTLGFDSSIRIIEQDLMVEVNLSGREYAVIDASSGEQYTHLEHHASRSLPIHFHVPSQALDSHTIQQIFLNQQKMAFTEEELFDKALCCIETLILNTPDDPYQRRDRGFLLHRLDCYPQAKHDFEFFIDNCPEDPAVQLLKLQIAEIDARELTFH